MITRTSANIIRWVFSCGTDEERELVQEYMSSDDVSDDWALISVTSKDTGAILIYERTNGDVVESRGSVNINWQAIRQKQ